MPQFAIFLTVLAFGYALLGGCKREPDVSWTDDGAVQRLASENEQLKTQNQELRHLHAQALAEMKSLRHAANRSDVAVRSSYLGLAPVGGILMLLGGALGVSCYQLIRRRRRGGPS
jgi:uncharacterized membrane protein